MNEFMILLVSEKKNNRRWLHHSFHVYCITAYLVSRALMVVEKQPWKMALSQKRSRDLLTVHFNKEYLFLGQ